MVIKKIEIGGFGKLENYSIDLISGIQFVYGPNEFGKSTLMEFLKTIFYSKREGEKSTSKDKILRQRYTPWSGSRMKGSVEFVHKGNLYKIQKEISSESPKKDAVLILNKSTGETITLGKNEEAGEYFFGIDIKSFERSSYIKNIGKLDFENSQNSKKPKDSLTDKILSNLSDTGEAETSKSLVTKRLDEAIRDLQFARGSGGKIFRAKSLISEINQKIYNLKLFEENQAVLAQELTRIKELRSELICLQAKIEKVKKFRKFSKIRDIIKLLDDKEKYIESLKMPHFKACSVIETLILKKEKTENHLTKIQELSSVLNSIHKNIILISESEINELNLKLKEKEVLENKIKEISYILKSKFYFSHENADFYNISENFNKLKKSKQDFEILKKEQANLENNVKEAEVKLSSFRKEHLKSTDNFKKKKLSIITVQLINFLVLTTSLCAGFFMSTFMFFAIYAIPFLLCCGYGVYYLKKSKKNLSLLTKDISTLEKDCSEVQSKYSTVLTDINIVENSIQKILMDETNSLEARLTETEKMMSQMLNLKNCLSVQDYYENYAKCQSIEKIRSSYQSALEEFKNIESEFIKNISKYKEVNNLNEASEVLKNFVFVNATIDNLEAKIKLELSALGFDENLDAVTLKKYNGSLCLNDEKIETDQLEFKKIEERIEFLKNLDLEEKYIEIQKNITHPSESLEQLEKRFKEQKNKLSDMESYLESLQTALSVIEESSDEMRKNFNPKLNARASEIFSCLTGGKYSQIHVDKNYGILVSNDMIDRTCDDFSSGTIDQAYLSLRIAISELISGENKMPLILDDVFMQYDDYRLNHVLGFLKKYSSKNPENNQIIIFTCHKHISDCALNKNILVKYVD